MINLAVEAASRFGVTVAGFVRNGSYHLKLLAKYCDDTKVLRFETLSSMLRKEPDLRPPLQA